MEIDETEFESENADIEDDDDEVQLTPKEIIELMEEAWLNEKFAPEVLPHKTEIVEILLGQISYLEENLHKLPSTDFRKSIYQMELDRLRFLVTSYLRLRLEKIEIFSTHILEQERIRSEKNVDMYLNQKELDFLHEYEQSITQHFEKVMSSCPGIACEPQVVQPDMHSMIFLRSRKKVDGIAIDDGNPQDGDLIDLTQDSQVLISYNSVANLVKNGDVHLI